MESKQFEVTMANYTPEADAEVELERMKREGWRPLVTSNREDGCVGVLFIRNAPVTEQEVVQ